MNENTFCVLDFARSIFLDNELNWICMVFLEYKRRESSQFRGHLLDDLLRFNVTTVLALVQSSWFS